MWLKGSIDPAGAAPISGANASSYVLDAGGADNDSFIFGHVTTTDATGGTSVFTAVSSSKVAAIDDLPTGTDSTIAIRRR